MNDYPLIEINLTGGARGLQGIQGEVGPTGPQGLQGDQGYSINSVEKLPNQESSDYDTYGVFLNDLAKTRIGTFIVYKGEKGDTGERGYSADNVQKISGTGEPGTIDVYGVYANDPDNTLLGTFNVYNGSTGPQGYGIGSVQKISGTGAAGTTDVYGVYSTDPSSTLLGTFNVYNGADGQGSGDMSKSTYDTDNDGIVDKAESLSNGTYTINMPNKNGTAATTDDVANSSSTLQANINELKIKTQTLTILTTDWVQNQTTQLYEYTVTDTNVTANHLVTGNMDLTNQAKMSDGYIESFDGGYKIITSELPEENITMQVTIQKVQTGA